MAGLDDLVSNLKNAVLNLGRIAQLLSTTVFPSPTPQPIGANPTATAGPVAVNGSATTFMRSDAAPAVQKASSLQFGIVEVDGTTITATGGVISSTGGGSSGANPTATAGPVAVNGVATTFLRSDGAPAVQLATAAQFGIVEVDNTTITAAAGVISAVQPTGHNPTATAGPTAVNGSATTFMRSDGAPAVQTATTGQLGLVEPDGTTITISTGVISAAAGANPTATAGPAAVNGSATTFLRSDGAPAVQLGTAAQKGIVQVDGTTIIAASGVISAPGSGVVADYVSGSFYFPFFVNSIGTQAVALNRIFAFFGTVGASVTIKALLCKNNSTSTRNAQMAIYSVAGNTLTLVDSTPSISLVTAGVVSSGTLNNTTDVLQPGVLYAFCFNQASTLSMFCVSTTGPDFNGSNVGSASSANLFNGSQMAGKSIAQAFGTWPGTLTLSAMSDEPVTDVQPPAIAFQVN